MVIWVTGLPGAGKTTIASVLFNELKALGKQVVLLDGDELRNVFGDFKYDSESRKKLANTYAKLALMLSKQGTYVICATVSMFHCVRDWNRNQIENYFEVYIKVEDSVLKMRNQKQLHSQAIEGEIDNVHGYDIEIEEPRAPDLTLENNGKLAITELANQIIDSVFEIDNK